MATPERDAAGLRWILLATAVAGALGYVIQVAAPRLLEDGAYVAFSVMWSTVYLCVAAMSGVQQEASRAARPSTSHAPNTVLRAFALSAAVVVLIVAIGLGWWLSIDTVPMAALALMAALGVAFVGYLMNAVLSGVLYGLQLWRGVALVTILDAVLRATFLAVAFAVSADTVWLGLGIAFPFGLSFAVGWVVLRRRVVGRFALDVGYRALSANVLSTVGAAACSGVMISGLPLLLGATSAGVPASALGSLIMAVNLTRAPIVVPVMALQSYLISAVFRDRASIAPRRLWSLIGISLLVMAALAGLAAAVGPWLMTLISAGSFSIAPLAIAIVVFSAGLVALMCVTGPALVAKGGHAANVGGWALAAVLTVGGLLLPIGFAERTLLALTVPAAAGLVVHVAALLRGAERSRPAPAVDLPA